MASARSGPTRDCRSLASWSRSRAYSRLCSQTSICCSSDVIYLRVSFFACSRIFSVFSPVIFIVVAILAFNFLGDGLRDAADPYTR